MTAESIESTEEEQAAMESGEENTSQDSDLSTEEAQEATTVRAEDIEAAHQRIVAERDAAVQRVLAQQKQAEAENAAAEAERIEADALLEDGEEGENSDADQQ